MEAEKDKNLFYDKRIIQKKILQGEMTEQDIRDYLESLPDLMDKSEEILLEP